MHNLESLLMKSAEWNDARKIKLGDKWLIVFWCGAILTSEDIETGYTYTAPTREDRLLAKWQAWCEDERTPLTLGSSMITMDGVLPVRLQQFLLPDGKPIYLRKEVLNFLPEKKYSYSCIVVDSAGDSVIYGVLVINAKNEIVAIFSNVVPKVELKGEQQ